MNNTTHDRVIALIADSGLSQADFARQCDLSVTNFSFVPTRSLIGFLFVIFKNLFNFVV